MVLWLLLHFSVLQLSNSKEAGVAAMRFVMSKKKIQIFQHRKHIKTEEKMIILIYAEKAFDNAFVC